MKKISIVLMNLGGPDNLENVKPFLRNLFSDPLVIRVPNFIRNFLSWFISTRREKKAQNIYKKIGNKSPILENTKNQADSLLNVLKNKYNDIDIKISIVMRYWHPRCEDIIKEIEEYNPDQIILLPLYPQFSTATTLSSINEFKHFLEQTSIKNVDLKTVCCFPEEENFIKSHVNLINNAIGQISNNDFSKTRILFSAHGIPEKFIKDGDPYRWQVELCTKKIMEQVEKINYVNCYQSKVGPTKWTEPSTEAEIIRAGKDGVDVILVPIAFVSEHSETLVELDMDYKELSESCGVKNYIRVPTLSVDKLFIDSLVNICSCFIEGYNLKFYPKNRICPKEFCACIR